MNTFVAGYIIVWASVVLYVHIMAVRQRRLTEQYKELQRQVENLKDRDASLPRAA